MKSPFMIDIAAPQVTQEGQAWRVECVKLDLGGKRAPFIMLAIDIYTRQPQVAVVWSAAAKDVAAALDRLIRQWKPPQEIWIDNGFDASALRHFSLQHRVAVVYTPPSPRWKALSEPIIRDLHAFFRDWRFSSLKDLSSGLQMWRQRYPTACMGVPNAGQ